MSAIEQTPEGLRLKIILQPKASKDQIVGLHDCLLYTSDAADE